MELAELRSKIRDIKNFPTEGILFKDITTLLKDPPAFRYVIDHLASRYQQAAVEIVVGIESRGFIFGGALAHQLDAGFVPVRKLGKLPGKTIEVEYELEYGRDALAVHDDAIRAGQRVLAVDDLLATGGTMAAARPPPLAEMLPDGSLRVDRAVITVRNPCPPGAMNHEPPPLPGRRARN